MAGVEAVTLYALLLFFILKLKLQESPYGRDSWICERMATVLVAPFRLKVVALVEETETKNNGKQRFKRENEYERETLELRS